MAPPEKLCPPFQSFLPQGIVFQINGTCSSSNPRRMDLYNEHHLTKNDVFISESWVTKGLCG